MQRLHLAMAHATGYVGLSFNPQAAVVQQDDMQRALSQESLKRGLVIVSPDFPDIDPEAKDKDLRLKPAQRLDLQLHPKALIWLCPTSSSAPASKARCAGRGRRLASDH